MWNKGWDSASVAASFLAVVTLGVLGDGLEGVRWDGLAGWLRKCQRVEDGGFGEGLGDDAATVVGGDDLRFCYCASGLGLVMERRGMGDWGERVGELDRYVQSCQVSLAIGLGVII